MEFNSISKVLKKEFGKKVIKLAIDGGFTCPNRDGTISHQGCIFCSEKGSGEFAGNRQDHIYQQMEQQVKLLSNKWKDAYYIAYFQSFTNTYDTIENLEKKYTEALSFPNVVGLAIATRADCLSDDVIALLQQFSKKTYLWVEIGLQTIHESSAKLIHRGYSLAVFEDALNRLQKANIKVVTHLILNLPNETTYDMIASVDYLIAHHVWGIKLHMLNILKNTALATYYQKHPFVMFDRETYIQLLIQILKRLPSDMVVHRITGDGKKDDLIAPKWICDKRYILNAIAKAK